MRCPRKLKYILGILAVAFAGICLYLQANYYPPILMYHNIDQELARSNTIAVSPDIFAKQMDFIKRRNYRVVPLPQLCRMIEAGKRLPRNLVVITFDDGYKDNLTAVKVLKAYDFPATVFLVIDRIGIPGYLTRQDLDWIEANSNVSFGSHTLSHCYLPEATDEQMKREIHDSKLKAKQRYGWDLETLAYCVGGFSPAAIEQVRQAGYLCACTTNRGLLRRPDIYALRRIKITNRDLGIRLWAKLTGYYNVFRKLKPPY